MPVPQADPPVGPPATGTRFLPPLSLDNGGFFFVKVGGVVPHAAWSF